jgi:outer membrane biosynthesis protein TonB
MCTMIADMTRGRTIFARALMGATLLSITLLASGCTKPVERDDARMATTPEQERSAPTQPAVRPQEASVEEKQKTPTVAAKQPAEPEPPVEQPAAPAPVYTASELMGKSEAEVTVLMGAPARVEQRAASTVWVYQGGDCGLDVFFFLDMATSDERVLTVAPTTQPASTAAPATAQAPAAGGQALAGEQAASATTADPAASSEGTAVDACYGKLRRS